MAFIDTYSLLKVPKHSNCKTDHQDSPQHHHIKMHSASSIYRANQGRSDTSDKSEKSIKSRTSSSKPKKSSGLCAADQHVLDCYNHAQMHFNYPTGTVSYTIPPREDREGKRAVQEIKCDRAKDYFSHKQ